MAIELGVGYPQGEAEVDNNKQHKFDWRQDRRIAHSVEISLDVS